MATAAADQPPSGSDPTDATVEGAVPHTSVLDLVSLRLVAVPDPPGGDPASPAHIRHTAAQACRACPALFVVGCTASADGEYFCYDTTQIDAGLPHNLPPQLPHNTSRHPCAHTALAAAMRGDSSAALEGDVAPRLLRALAHLHAMAAGLRDRCAQTLEALHPQDADATATAWDDVRAVPGDDALGAVCAAVADVCAGAVTALVHGAAHTHAACAASLRALDADVGAGAALLADLAAQGPAPRCATALQALHVLARATATGLRLRDATGAVAAALTTARARTAAVHRACAHVTQRLRAEAARRAAARGVVRDLEALRTRLAALLTDAHTDADADAAAAAAAAAPGLLLARLDAATADAAAVLSDAAPVCMQQVRALERARAGEAAAARARLEAAADGLRRIAGAAGAGPGADAAATLARVEQLRARAAALQADVGAVVAQLVQTAQQCRDADARAQDLADRCAALGDENARLRAACEAGEREAAQLRRANADLREHAARAQQQPPAQPSPSPPSLALALALSLPGAELPRIETVGPFCWGQTAVFVRQRAGVYEAANVGHPHFFLHDESVQAVAHSTTPVAVARLICEPEAHAATADNPYGLRAGEAYWLCLCEVAAHD